MGDEPALEHALLEHLQFAPSTRAQPARRTAAGERPTWGTVALMLLPVLVVVGFIVASLGFGHASLPTAVLFIIAVVGVMLWSFRSRRK